jgi:hypothetical protein
MVEAVHDVLAEKPKSKGAKAKTIKDNPIPGGVFGAAGKNEKHGKRGDKAKELLFRGRQWDYHPPLALAASMLCTQAQDT